MKGELHKPKPPLSRRKPRKSTESKKVIIKKNDDDENSDESDNTNSKKSQKTLSPKSNCFKLRSNIRCKPSLNQAGQSSPFDNDSDGSSEQKLVDQRQSKGTFNYMEELSTSRYKKSQQAVKNVIGADKKTRKRKVSKSRQTNNLSDEDDFDKPVKKSCLSAHQNATNILTTMRKGKRIALQLKKNKTIQNVNVNVGDIKEEMSGRIQVDNNCVNKNINGCDPLKNSGDKEKINSNGHLIPYWSGPDSADDKKIEGSCDLENERPLKHLKIDPVTINECNGNIELEPDRKDVSDLKDGIKCPVCKKVFDASEDLAKINEHANSCIDCQTEDKHDDNGQAKNTAGDSSKNASMLGDKLKPQSSLSILQDQIAAFEYQKQTNPDLDDEGLFFCQICQKDLSRMNTQRRAQHINKCCDKVESVEDSNALTTTSDGSVSSNILCCPFCTTEMKSKKAWTMHIKKCAQKNNVPTSHLLEIKNQQEQIETMSKNEGMTTTRTTNQTAKTTQPKKRKNTRQNLRGIDEETQLAMAMSASMAPPTSSPDDDSLVKKQKRQRKKGNEVIPALLLRSEEETKSVIAARAAEVVCSKDGDSDDDSISCTPALAPSSLAQQFAQVEQANKQLYGEEQLLPKAIKPKDTTISPYLDSSTGELQKTSEQECDPNSKEPISFETSVISLSDMIDNSDMCKSFLRFLHVDDEEGSNTGAKKDSPKMIDSLWSMASLDNKENWTPQKFYVPGLLPAQSPKWLRKSPSKLLSSASRKKRLLSKQSDDTNDVNFVKTNQDNEHSRVQVSQIDCKEQSIEEKQNGTNEENASSKVYADIERLDKQQIEKDTTGARSKLTRSEMPEKGGENSTVTSESHAEVDTSSTENGAENDSKRMKTLNSTAMLSQSNSITESQAVNVDILMELAGDSDVDDESGDDNEGLTQQERSSSDDDQDVFPSSGFYVPIKHTQEEEASKSLSSSVNTLLHDLSYMVGNSLLSDVTIVTKDKQSIPAHSFMLMSRSKVFADMIQKVRGTEQESLSYQHISLTLDDVDEDVMRCVLKYIYTATVSIPQNLLLTVKHVAQRLKLDKLERFCLNSTEDAEKFPNDSEDDNGSRKPISAEDLLDAIFDKESGNENIKGEGDRENSQEDWVGGFDDDDIEEVRIFQSQSNQKMRSMSKESRSDKALRSVLGLVDDVTVNCVKRDTSIARDATENMDNSKKRDSNETSVKEGESDNSLRDKCCEGDDQQSDSNADEFILLSDENNEEHLRDNEKRDESASCDESAGKPGTSQNDKITNDKLMCDAESNNDEPQHISDTEMCDAELHYGRLCDINDQGINKPENEERDTPDDVCDIDRKIRNRESHEIAENVDIQPEQTYHDPCAADADEVHGGNGDCFEIAVIDRVDLTFEGEEKEDGCDGDFNGGNDGDGGEDGDDEDGHDEDGDGSDDGNGDGDDSSNSEGNGDYDDVNDVDVMSKPTCKSTDESMFKDIDSDEYDGDVAILNQSISLLSNDDNHDDDDVITSPKDQVMRNVVPETPNPKSNRVRAAEMKDLWTDSSPSKPTTKTSSGSNSYSSYPDSDNTSDGDKDEDGDAFLEKLRANIKTNKRKKKRKEINARKTRSTLQRRDSDIDSSEIHIVNEKVRKSNAKRSTSKGKSSKSKEGNNNQESCIRNKACSSSNTQKMGVKLMDVDEVSDEDGGNYLKDIENGDNDSDKEDKEFPFEDQIEDLMNDNSSTAALKLLSPVIPSPHYTVSSPPNDISSLPCKVYSPSKNTPSPPRSGPSTSTSFPSLKRVDLEVTNIDDSDVEEESWTVNHNVTMPTTPLTSLVSSPLKSVSGKSLAKDVGNEGLKDELSSEGETNLETNESKSGKSGFASVTSSKSHKALISDISPSGTSTNEIVSKGISIINSKKSLFQRLKANTYGLDKDEVAVSSDEESEFSTPPLSSQDKDATQTAVNNQIDDFEEDGGFNCDIDEFVDYYRGGSFMVNAAEDVESRDQDNGGASGAPCTPAHKLNPSCTKVPVIGHVGDSMENASPITPIPDFQNMETPELKCEVSKFGVRPLPKKKMVAKLNEIHVYLRQVKHGVSSSQSDVQNSEPPSKTSIRAVSQIQANSTSDENSGPSQPSKARSKSTRGKTSKKNPQKKKQDGPKRKGVDIHLQEACLVEDVNRVGSSDGDGGSIGGGVGDSENEEEEFGEVSVLIDSETATQQVQSDDLTETLRMYITSNHDIYLKVLNYQPIDFMALHELIKSDGIKCSAGKLLDFLDEQCITFTTAGSKPRQKRRKPPRKK